MEEYYYPDLEEISEIAEVILETEGVGGSGLGLPSSAPGIGSARPTASWTAFSSPAPSGSTRGTQFDPGSTGRAKSTPRTPEPVCRAAIASRSGNTPGFASGNSSAPGKTRPTATTGSPHQISDAQLLKGIKEKLAEDGSSNNPINLEFDPTNALMQLAVNNLKPTEPTPSQPAQPNVTINVVNNIVNVNSGNPMGEGLTAILKNNYFECNFCNDLIPEYLDNKGPVCLTEHVLFRHKDNLLTQGETPAIKRKQRSKQNRLLTERFELNYPLRKLPGEIVAKDPLMITKALKQITHEKTPIANQLTNDSSPLDAPEHEKNMEIFYPKSNDGNQMLISKQGDNSKSDNIIRYGTLRPRPRRLWPKNKQIKEIKEPESKNPKRARK